MSWRHWTDYSIDPSSSLPIAALLSHLGLICSTVGHWGPQSPQSATWFFMLASCLLLTQTVWAPGYIIFYRPPASAVLPLIYTGASLDWRLGRGSIYNNLRRLAVIQTPVNDHQLTLTWKTLKEEIIIIKIRGNVENGNVFANPIYPTLPLGQDMTQGQFLSGV